MREVKFIELGLDVVDKYTEVLDGDILIKIKPFYTIAEKMAIVEDMKSKETSIEREFSKVVLTVKFNTNIDVSDMSDNDIYDLASELRLIDEFEIDIQGFIDLDKLVKDDESTYAIANMFIDKLGEMAKLLEGKANMSQTDLMKLGMSVMNNGKDI